MPLIGGGSYKFVPSLPSLLAISKVLVRLATSQTAVYQCFVIYFYFPPVFIPAIFTSSWVGYPHHIWLFFCRKRWEFAFRLYQCRTRVNIPPAVSLPGEQKQQQTEDTLAADIASQPGVRNSEVPPSGRGLIRVLFHHISQYPDAPSSRFIILVKMRILSFQRLSIFPLL